MEVNKICSENKWQETDLLLKYSILACKNLQLFIAASCGHSRFLTFIFQLKIKSHSHKQIYGSLLMTSVLSSSFSWLLVGEMPAKAGTQNTGSHIRENAAILQISPRLLISE